MFYLMTKNPYFRQNLFEFTVLQITSFNYEIQALEFVECFRYGLRVQQPQASWSVGSRKYSQTTK
jgi:hypothetical protein